MQVNTDQWYARWFLWSCRVLDRWHMDDGDREYRARMRGTNLCGFFRTLLWGVLISASSLAVWIYAATTILVLPFVVFNITTVATTVAMTVAIFTAVVALLTALVAAPDIARWAGERVGNLARTDTTQPPGFAGICWSYIKGIKQRFCPTITFKDTNEDA